MTVPSPSAAAGRADLQLTHRPKETTVAEQPAANTDRELYREDTGDGAGSYYENSVHVTADGRIGMNVGGTVIVQPIADWHAQAAAAHLARLGAAPAHAEPPQGHDEQALREALRAHHPTMRSETGPFSGCRCGGVKLGQDVIQHVVDQLRSALAHSAAPALVEPGAAARVEQQLGDNDRREQVAYWMHGRQVKRQYPGTPDAEVDRLWRVNRTLRQWGYREADALLSGPLAQLLELEQATGAVLMESQLAREALDRVRELAGRLRTSHRGEEWDAEGVAGLIEQSLRGEQ